MRGYNHKGRLLSVNVLIALMPFLSWGQGLVCADLFEDIRGVATPKIEWNSDKSYIEALQRQEVYGQVETYFSKKWDTQVYYTKTALPNHKGEVPLVDPNSKAVFIFFHGSGTMKSSGRNYIGNMNNLANMGFSAISVDMPFHGEGPRDHKYDNAFEFMEWSRAIVLEAKKSGKPVYLVGHSFGPDVILEFAARYPKTIDGVVALSPAAFTKELSKWYDNYTTKMKFGGDVPENEAGGLWAAKISKQFHWSRNKLADPTVVNPNLNIRILSGNREEYVPAPLSPETGLPIGENTYDVSVPLRAALRNATITIEPGIGHYLFEHNDSNGHNVVMRELLAVAGENIANQKAITDALKKENQIASVSIHMAKKYSQDLLFRSWADMTYGPGKVLQIALQGQDSFVAKVMNEYSNSQKEREAEIYAKILNSRETHPEFYEKYKALIEKMNPKKVDLTLFYPWLNMVLSAAQ